MIQKHKLFEKFFRPIQSANPKYYQFNDEHNYIASLSDITVLFQYYTNLFYDIMNFVDVLS